MNNSILDTENDVAARIAQPDPGGQVRRWVEGVLSQTRKEIAATTLAVLWNGGSIGETVAAGRPSTNGPSTNGPSTNGPSTNGPSTNGPSTNAPLAALLRDPFARLGSAAPDLDASLAAHAVIGKISDYLWPRTTPTPAELDHITAFCLRAATSTPPAQLAPPYTPAQLAPPYIPAP